jgi:hypothetical protein
MTVGKYPLDSVGLKTGDKLSRADNPSVKYEVNTNNSVLFEGNNHSLSCSAQLVCERLGITLAVKVHRTMKWFGPSGELVGLMPKVKP